MAIVSNTVFRNNKFCPKSEETPVATQGGGILLLGARPSPGWRATA